MTQDVYKRLDNRLKLMYNFTLSNGGVSKLDSKNNHILYCTIPNHINSDETINLDITINEISDKIIVIYDKRKMICNCSEFSIIKTKLKRFMKDEPCTIYF